MNIERRVIRSTGIVFFASLAAAVFGYTIRVLFARNLSPGEFGLFYAVFAVVSFLDSFTGLNITTAATQKIASDRTPQTVKDASVITFVAQAVIYAVIAIGLVIASQTLSTQYFKNPASVTILLWFIFAFAFTVIDGTVLVIFQGTQRFFPYAIQGLLRNAAILGFGFVLFRYGFGLWSAVYAYVIAYALMGVLNFFWARGTTPALRLPTRWNKELFRELFKFAVPVTLSNAAMSILAYIDTISLTLFRTLVDVGQYNVALPFATVLRYFSKSIAIVVYPLSSELHAHQHPGFAPGITRLLNYLLFVIVPLVVGTIIIAPLLIPFVFGVDYLAAITPTQLLALGAIPTTFATIFPNILLGIGKVKTQSKMLVFAGIINTIASFALVPLFGMVGAALSAIISQTVLGGISVFLVVRELHAQLPWKGWLGIITAGIIQAAATIGLFWLINPALLSGIGLVIIGAFIYVALAVLFRSVHISELTAIAKKIRPSR